MTLTRALFLYIRISNLSSYDSSVSNQYTKIFGMHFPFLINIFVKFQWSNTLRIPFPIIVYRELNTFEKKNLSSLDHYLSQFRDT